MGSDRMKRLLAGGLVAFCLLGAGGPVMAGDMTAAERQAVYEKPRLEDEAEQPGSRKAETAGEKSRSETVRKREATRYRFKKIGTDQSYTYFADTKNMRWVYMPGSREQMVDVWVKAVSFSDYYSDGKEAALATDYQLFHYYLRPKKQQIQFLCEIAVKGRPTNQVQERAYNVRNWENLVPGSIEDVIYHAVMDNIEELPEEGKRSEIESLGDGLEDVFRIAL